VGSKRTWDHSVKNRGLARDTWRSLNPGCCPVQTQLCSVLFLFMGPTCTCEGLVHVRFLYVCGTCTCEVLVRVMCLYGMFVYG